MCSSLLQSMHARAMARRDEFRLVVDEYDAGCRNGGRRDISHIEGRWWCHQVPDVRAPSSAGSCKFRIRARVSQSSI